MSNEPKVIFEDNDILVIDKPSGWITNDAQTTGNQPVIQKWLYDNFSYPIAKESELRSGIVHRLDKETSGVLAVAKTSEAFGFIQDQFKKRLVSKKYTALSHGNVEPEMGVIEVPVGRLPWSRKKFGIIPGGRDSKTSYEAVSKYKKGSDLYTLLELKPETGRTHQIRIHLRYLGYPIVSDVLYAGRKTFKKDRKWCPRLFLHSGFISFTHPVTSETVKVESPVPSDLESVLASLEKIAVRT